MTRHAVNFINTNGAMIIHLLLCRVNSLDETVITASLLQADDMSKHLNAQSGTSSLDNFVHKLIVKCNREVSIFLLPNRPMYSQLQIKTGVLLLLWRTFGLFQRLTLCFFFFFFGFERVSTSSVVCLRPCQTAGGAYCKNSESFLAIKYFRRQVLS